MKAKLRQELKERLRAITPEHQSALQNQLRGWLPSCSGRWGAFWPLPGEPDLRPLWQELRPGLRWVFPRIRGTELTFHEAGSEHWTEGPYGTREPGPHAPRIAKEDIQGLLIPGLAFDRSGRRLGRGKGFYDRCLADWNGKKVGVCFELQWVPEVPHEAHDQNMDVIVTEAGVWQMPSRME